MSTICFRCALQLRVEAVSASRTASRRAFSTTRARRKGPLPQFAATSQPELDNVLASLRDKWLIPAALSPQERNLIYKPRYIKQLEESPEIVTIGDEDIELHHINRFTDVPSFKRDLLPKIIDLMSKGERSDWNNLPALLIGLKKAKLTPNDAVMGKIARKAVEAGRFGVILQCLQQHEQTQMKLTNPEILDTVMEALREVAQNDQWSEPSTSKALREAHAIAMVLENSAGAAKARPEVLAVYLELAAVYASKHQDGKDLDGKVRAYAQRLLNNMRALEERSAGDGKADSCVRPSTTTPATKGRQTEILKGVPIYHGLRLAFQILDEDMPQPAFAREIVQAWGTGLEALIEGLKAQTVEKAHGLKRWPKSGTFGWQALRAWRSCQLVKDH